MRLTSALAGMTLAIAVGAASLAAPPASATSLAPSTSRTTSAARHLPPMHTSQLLPALRKYRRYVHARIVQLVPETDQLQAELAKHDASAAKSAWLTAHLTWLRIGQDDGAYGIFGDLGRSIDGTAAGYPRGVDDPGFTGFHRIERDLWAKHNLGAAHADAVKLASDVHRLAHVSLTQAIPPNMDGANTFTLRPHEIIEDAVRDTLSGDDEYGSGTALASITADVAAVRETLKLLAPLINRRSPGRVAKSRRDLTLLLDEAMRGKAHGRWVAIRSLARSRRELIDAAAGAADEELAPIPDLLEIGP